MAGEKSGEAAQIRSFNSKYLYIHCYGHALNLSIKDACTKVQCLILERRFVSWWKQSPWRETSLRKLRLESGNEEKSVHVPCPTRWTVREITLFSIISNHNELIALWEQYLLITKDTEMKGRIIDAQINIRKFLFILSSTWRENINAER